MTTIKFSFADDQVQFVYRVRKRRQHGRPRGRGRRVMRVRRLAPR